MNFYRDHYHQFELFPGNAEIPILKKRQRIFPNRLTLSLENLVVLSIIIMMSMILAFSMGVERGKIILAKQSIRTITENSQKTAASEPGPGTNKEPAAAADAVGPIVPNKDSSEPVESVQGEQVVVLANTLPVKDEALAKNDSSFYTVQIASYNLAKYAHKEAENLKQKGYETIVAPKGKHAILCVGKFMAKDEANAMSRKLRKSYKDCLVRRM